MKNKELVDSLTKDMSKGVGRIMSKKELLENLDEKNLKLLEDKVAAYNPKSAIGRESQNQAFKLIGLRKAELAGVPVDTASEVDMSTMVQQKTCMLKIKVPQPGMNMCINTRTFVEKSKDPNAKIDLLVDDGDNEAGFDYTRHTVVQKLFGKQYIKPLVSQRVEFFGALKRRAVPSSILSNDCFLVPRTLIPSTIEEIERLTVERNALLDEFEGKYAEAQQDAKEKLGVHFDQTRYPSFDQIRAKFEMYFRWQDVNPAVGLKEISKAAYEKEVQNAKMDWDTTFGDIREGLRAGFMDLVGGFADSMGNDESGKPKIFHASKVEKLKDFLTTFEARDLTNDEDLASLATQAKELISTVDPKALRKDMSMRQNLAETFGKIKDQAAEMVVVRGRKLKLGE